MEPCATRRHSTAAPPPRSGKAVLITDFSPTGNALVKQFDIELKDFGEGRRTDPVMTPISKVLSRDEMIALGNWYAAQKPATNQFKADSAKVDAGRKISDAVLCPMCHGGGFIGQNEVPRVAGQNPEYIRKQLQDFRAKRRTNDAGNMTSVAHALSDVDIENLSHYIGNLN